MALAISKSKSFVLEDVFEDDEFKNMRGWVYGVISTYKYMKICDIQIDGMSDFFVEDRGNFDFEYVIQEVKELKFTNDYMVGVFNSINKYFEVDKVFEKRVSEKEIEDSEPEAEPQAVS